MRVANNKDADQPAHARSLISAFVIRLLEIIISRLASSEISTFWLGTVAEETGSKELWLLLPLCIYASSEDTGDCRDVQGRLNLSCLTIC